MNIQKRKIVIIGAGHVGSHAGYALISQGLAEEIVYIDVDEKKAVAQALDLYDSTVYLPRRAIVRAGDYSPFCITWAVTSSCCSSSPPVPCPT